MINSIIAGLIVSFLVFQLGRLYEKVKQMNARRKAPKILTLEEIKVLKKDLEKW